MKNKIFLIVLGSLTGLSALFTIVTVIGYFEMSGAELNSYPFYQRALLYLDQTQEHVGYAIFRIGGPFLLPGLVAYWLVFLAFMLPAKAMKGNLERKTKKKVKRKFLDRKSFKAPGASMYFKWAALLLYFAFVFLFAGYYLNDIALPGDFWIRYVLFYMYGILGGILLNHLFNYLAPCKSNVFFEAGFFLLLFGGCLAAFFFLDRLGVSLTYYIHSCILLGAIALINLADFMSPYSFHCPECGGRCKATLLDKSYEELGRSTGYRDAYEKVGTRETTITISDEQGSTVAEGKGSEDIYEKYTQAYEIVHWKSIYTYDCECLYCHAHHQESKSYYHTS